MAKPSRTEWPDWVVRPVMCSKCSTRVTLKDAHWTHYDVATRKGSVYHWACVGVAVTVSAALPSLGVTRAGSDLTATRSVICPSSEKPPPRKRAASLARIADEFPS